MIIDRPFMVKAPNDEDEWPTDKPSKEDPSFVEHIEKNGSHHHVVQYGANGAYCSEPRCIMNKKR